MEDGRIVKQGLGLVKPNVFLSDLFEKLIKYTKISERVSARFQNITQDQYTLGLDMIWWVLSSLQYWEELSSVENGGVLEESETEKLINGYKKWLRS
jgi:hypothetical protein